MFVTGEEIAQDVIETLREYTQKENEEAEYEYHKKLIQQDPNLLILERYLNLEGYDLIRLSDPNESDCFKFKIKKQKCLQSK